jgi:hypothetical protein
MSSSFEPGSKELEEMKQIERLTRQYAQNRSLPVVVGLVAFGLFFFAIAVPSVVGGIAYRHENMVVFGVCVAVAAVAIAGLIYLAVPRWGARRIQKLADNLYGDEGRAAIHPAVNHSPWFIASIAIAFGICVITHVLLSVFGYLPAGKFMQPISALYTVPFLAALNVLMRPATGWVPLLWPVLYALHAVLILAGAPIAFEGIYDPLNMLVPTLGYGLVTALIGHLYSRWALHSVRSIVSRQLDEAQLQHDGGQP